MKHIRRIVIAVLVFTFLLGSVAMAANGTMPAAGKVPQERKAADRLFRAKFEGQNVAGSGESVDGVYRFIATETDGEAWHVKLESNYPTVAGRDYRVTYRFTSDVAGKVKFGDFQEFEIQKGENEVTGILIATGGTSYLDLQLGMLKPFTIDFTEVEIEEFADEVEYENALPAPVNFMKESVVYERHDQGYAPVLTRSSDGVNINYVAAPWETGVWKSRLYVNTGMIPESGTRYHITADVSCDQDMPFEVLFNNGDTEKGYGALYGQTLTAGQVTTCEAVITGGSDGDELILQFSLGEAPEESTLQVNNLRVEKIIDHYRNALPAAFSLDRTIATGKTYTVMTPTSYKDVTPESFSWSAVDTIYEGHDDDYVVSLSESADSATLAISQAPASGRGVWKAKLYAATGVALQAGETYRIKYDLHSANDQAEYEVCFDGSAENAFGALYGRSLTAGGTDHVEYVVTPDAAKGPLTLRLQLGKTDTPAGNTLTLSKLSVERLSVTSTDLGTVNPTVGNVWEEHGDGVEQTVSASGATAALNVTQARTGGGIWSSKLLVATGVTPEAGAKYRVSATVAATGETGSFEILYRKGSTDANYDGNWAPNGPGTWTSEFVAPADASAEMVLVFQFGNTAAPNTITVSNISVQKITGGTMTPLVLSGFAYPTATEVSTVNNSFDLEANNGAAAALTGNGTSATATVTTPGDDWHVKLYAKPGLALEAGTAYTISMDVTGAAGCTACYKNTATGAEDGFGTESITADGTVTHTVTPTSNGTVEILLKIGNVPANTAVTVSNVQLKKITTDYIPQGLPASFYPTVMHHDAAAGSFAIDHGTITGDGTKAVATVSQTYGSDWENKLYAKPGLTLVTGKVYRVSGSVSNYGGTVFFKNTANGNEEGFGTASISGGAFSAYVSPAVGGELEIMLKVGLVSPEAPVTISGIKVEECTLLNLSGTDYNLEFNTPGGGTPGSGTMNGNSFTITATPDPQDNWPTKFFVRPHQTLASGKSYLVGFTIESTHDGFDVCYLNPDPWNEEAHGGHSWVVTNTPFRHVIVGEGKEMQLVLKAGWAGVGVTTTVSNLMIADLSSTTDVTPATFAYPTAAYDETTSNAFALTANSGAAALSGAVGDSSTYAKATVSTAGDITLVANTGLTLTAGKNYRVQMTVAGADGTTVSFKNATTNEANGFGTASITGGALTHSFTAAANGALQILLPLNGLAANGEVTVSGIQIAEYTTGELSVLPAAFAYPVTTPGTVTANSFDLEAGNGTAAALTGSGNSATATVTTPGDDWHIKFYAKPGTELQAGQTYTINMNVTGAAGCTACYKNTATGAEDGFGTESITADGTVTHTVTPAVSGTVEILLKIGAVPAGNSVTLSGLTISSLSGETAGDNLMTASLTTSNVNFWAHDTYAAALSGSGSANLAITTTPADGREAWKVKLFVETGLALATGKNYRVSADVIATADTDYEICYSGTGEGSFGTLTGLHAASEAQTVRFEALSADDTNLMLQFNLGLAIAPCTVTVSNVKVEEVTYTVAEDMLPSFRYDSVGYVRATADAGYITELAHGGASATFRIYQAPAERNAWNARVYLKTGVVPKQGKGYRVSFDVEAASTQDLYEVFFDGTEELAYGALYERKLSAGKQSISYTIMPGDSKGPITVQFRPGKTNTTTGNTYTLSNLKIEEVTFVTTETSEIKNAAELSTQNGYTAVLDKTADRATVRLDKTPSTGREAWKNKLFIYTGVTLVPGQKYRVSMDIKSIIPAPFEVCYNDGDEEKGVGAQFGLISTPTGQYVEYVTYAGEAAHLVIQLSLGNCSAPNTIIVSNIHVEQAGVINPVSDTVYTF